MFNLGMTALVSGLFLVVILVFLKRNHGENRNSKTLNIDEIKASKGLKLLEITVKETFHQMLASNLYELGLTEEAYEKRVAKRRSLKRSLKNCAYGVMEDKAYVKAMMRDILIQDHLKPHKMDDFMAFEQPWRLNVKDKFDILMYHYRKSYGLQAFENLVTKYDLDRPRFRIEEGQTMSYIISHQDIEEIYEKEHIVLNYEDQIEVIVQQIYENYKGYGVIDELRDMDIDGISGGVSGTSAKEESVWVFYKGKSLHLSFLAFGSKQELRRICQNIYRFHQAGQLSERDGYQVSEMADGSRVVVVRPPFSENWAFFVRKFHIRNVALEQLLKDQEAQVCIDLLKFLVKGARIMSVTGAQGTGKTTLLMALIAHIYATLTLRVQEMAFELHLREVYPMRNILTFRETAHISGQEGLDVQKKTDGAVNILGEVATDEVAVWMLQMAQVASLFTLFTHHAKTTDDLCLSLRNALLKTQVFRDETIALRQVVKVLNFDIHLEKGPDGHRYIERITEIIPLPDSEDYPQTYELRSESEQRQVFRENVKEYFYRKTDRPVYKMVDILVYENQRYRIVNAISETNTRQMRANMAKRDQEDFDAFLIRHFGR